MTCKNTFEISLQTYSDTERLGFELALQVSNRALVALVGPLGAGKTTFAKGVADGLGVDEVVSSPTFTMINEYASGHIPFYHLDLYRLGETGQSNEGAVADLQMLTCELDEIAAGDGLILIEWANYFPTYVTQRDHVLVELNYSIPASDGGVDSLDASTNSRVARLSGSGPISNQVVDELQIVYFS